MFLAMWLMYFTQVTPSGGVTCFICFDWFWYVAQLSNKSQLMDFRRWLSMSHKLCDTAYESHRVRVEGRIPVEGHTPSLGFGAWTISSTPPAIEIWTRWKFMVNIHPRTLSDQHQHYPWAAPPPAALIPASCFWALASLLLGVLWLHTYPLIPSVSLPRLGLVRLATPSRPCYSLLGLQFAVGENLSTGSGWFLRFLHFS